MDTFFCVLLALSAFLLAWLILKMKSMCTELDPRIETALINQTNSCE